MHYTKISPSKIRLSKISKCIREAKVLCLSGGFGCVYSLESCIYLRYVHVVGVFRREKDMRRCLFL